MNLKNFTENLDKIVARHAQLEEQLSQGII